MGIPYLPVEQRFAEETFHQLEDLLRDSWGVGNSIQSTFEQLADFVDGEFTFNTDDPEPESTINELSIKVAKLEAALGKRVAEVEEFKAQLKLTEGALDKTVEELSDEKANSEGVTPVKRGRKPKSVDEQSTE